MSDTPDVVILDVGHTVICDVCDEDWTGNPESGGFLFETKAYCPKCVRTRLDSIKSYDEERFIRAWCPPNLSFADWVLQLRDGKNYVKIVTVQ